MSVVVRGLQPDIGAMPMAVIVTDARSNEPNVAEPRPAELQSCAAFYRSLTGIEPAAAVIADDTSFDRHVLACILAVAAAEGGSVSERSGLTAPELAVLLERFFPLRRGLAATAARATAEDDEVAMLRELLQARRSTQGEVGHWLAAMVARRSMEPNHLWEDLGLRERAELSRLLQRHFAPLAERNTRNMRWKRFFYRSMCEDDGFVMCTTPVCTECADFHSCFGDESGESRMAARRRAGAADPVGTAEASP
ncbi:nitrogen fixation protein NifQ [Bradyrhizobium sp. WD16]|uniref:nitrogen fixation protein NifQ n=1 Tax=Bradyrhizobium sp. WD16 TaxID=1521768 RepID=UPI0020A2880E|nr:nitrogen fixation protein NifQ [Bradyrhizobium sp. WD16]